MQWQVVIFCSFPATNVPDRVLRAMAGTDGGPSLTRISELTRACLNALKPVSKPPPRVPSSFRHPAPAAGKPPHELPEPGDKVLISRFGQFSHLWRICAPAGLRRGNFGDPGAKARRLSDTILLEFGQAAQDQSRAGMPEETATGVTSDVAAYARLWTASSIRTPVRGLRQRTGQHRVSHGRLGRRRLHQRLAKGLMLPAGLGVTCVSQKALEAPRRRPRAAATSTTRYGGSNASGYFPNSSIPCCTPA